MTDWRHDFWGYDTRSDFASPELVTLLATENRPGLALDLGCGHGTEALYLAEMGWSVVGIDKNTSALDVAKQRRAARRLPDQRIRFVRGDACAPSAKYRKGSFDLVLSRLLINNLGPRDQFRLTRAAAAACRPGGTLMLVKTNAAAISKRAAGILRAEFVANGKLWRTYVGLSTPRPDQTDDGHVLVATPLDLSLCVARRRGAG